MNKYIKLISLCSVFSMSVAFANFISFSLNVSESVEEAQYPQTFLYFKELQAKYALNKIEFGKNLKVIKFAHLEIPQDFLSKLESNDSMVKMVIEQFIQHNSNYFSRIKYYTMLGIGGIGCLQVTAQVCDHVYNDPRLNKDYPLHTVSAIVLGGLISSLGISAVHFLSSQAYNCMSHMVG